MKPIKVTGVQMAFGGDAMKLLPPYKEIPKEFTNSNTRNKWNKFSSDWFFNGLKNLKVTPKDGINPEEAIRHLSTILRSFEPKHEHKEAGVAYLASQWFDDVQYEVNK